MGTIMTRDYDAGLIKEPRVNKEELVRILKLIVGIVLLVSTIYMMTRPVEASGGAVKQWEAGVLYVENFMNMSTECKKEHANVVRYAAPIVINVTISAVKDSIENQTHWLDELCESHRDFCKMWQVPYGDCPALLPPFEEMLATETTP